MTKLPYRIAYLADHPEHVETVARWWWDEWMKETTGGTFEAFAQRCRQIDCYRNQLNVTLIALHKEKIVGVIQLVEDEWCPGYRDVSPWLGSLYVLPEYRYKAVAFQLGYVAINKALEMGFEHLYAYTGNLDKVLMRHHFSKIDIVDYNGEPHRVYRKTLL